MERTITANIYCDQLERVHEELKKKTASISQQEKSFVSSR
jgi:hypothetical protein